MKKVNIIKGAYGYQPEEGGSIRAVTRKDGPIVLPDEEAARLVFLRVAEYIPDPNPEVPGSGVATGQGGTDESGEGDSPPTSDPGAEGQENGEQPKGNNDGENTLDIVDGHFTAESLATLTNANLEKLANNLGADVRKCKTKADYIAVLITVEIKDDDLPPTLGAEAPVI